MREFDYKNGVCPIGFAIKVIGGKWKIAIIWQLRQETLRFGELNRKLPTAISQSVLTKQLRELEADGIIHREIYKEIPPKVEYSLTDIGTEFLKVIVNIGEWSEEHLFDDQTA